MEDWFADFTCIVILLYLNIEYLLDIKDLSCAFSLKLFPSNQTYFPQAHDKKGK